MVDTPDDLRMPPDNNMHDWRLVGECLFHGRHNLGVVRVRQLDLGGKIETYYASAVCDDRCGFRAVWRRTEDIDCRCDPLMNIRKDLGGTRRRMSFDEFKEPPPDPDLD